MEHICHFNRHARSTRSTPRWDIVFANMGSGTRRLWVGRFYNMRRRKRDAVESKQFIDLRREYGERYHRHIHARSRGSFGIHWEGKIWFRYRPTGMAERRSRVEKSNSGRDSDKIIFLRDFWTGSTDQQLQRG